ncbi:MAG: tetratricopeptide repeat protein [Gammaproteobacteria bacterium]|nr:tetratricopeptide repeat protein [Gammaproteobacteria bacterium]
MLSISDKLKKINAAIAADPNQPLYYNSLGTVFRQLDQFDNALVAYQKALSLNENYAEAHANIGILLTALEKDDDALLHLEKAISLNPNLLPALNQVADIYLRHEKYTQARDTLLRSLEITPENCELNHRLGIAYFKLRDFENAHFQFENVLMVNHKHPEINQYLANTLLELGEHEKAMTYYFRQLELNPFFETNYNLGVLFMMKERLSESLMYFDQALLMEPDDFSTHLNCGNVFLKKNNIPQAIICYEKANTLKPNESEIQHILCALKQEKTPDTAPADYVAHLFDQYAPYYDHHLSAALKYDAPQKMLSCVMLANPKLFDMRWKILDLGCGTGLCGALFKSAASQLIGVDLSDNMLAVAREKNIYDDLILSDLTQALKTAFSVDLICAADVFTYIGDLELIFKLASNALVLNGLFVFTVEKTTEKEFILQTTIRYAHSKSYLDRLIKNHPFEIISFENVQLRKQKNQAVEGYLVLLRKL